MDAKKISLIIVAVWSLLGIMVACAPGAAPAPVPPSAAPPRVNLTPTPASAPLLSPTPAPTVRAGGPSVPRITLTPAQHPVKRPITIDAGDQTVGGQRRALRVGALNLPADPPSFPAKGGNSVKLLTSVWEPDVRFADNNSVAATFDPPLTVNVEFTAEDSKVASRGADGKPRLYLFIWYRDGAAIKWERLPTTVTCTGNCDTGTLSAQISNLRPSDPVSEGFD